MLKTSSICINRVVCRLLCTGKVATKTIDLSPSLVHEFTLYGFVHSQPVRSVLLLMDEFKLDYKLISVNPISKETSDPEYLKINPTGLIPCLTHKNTSIGEGSCIMQYICNSKQDIPSMLNMYPVPNSTESAQKRAKIDFWLSWHHHNTRNCTLKVFHPFVFRKMYANDGGYEKVLASGMKSIRKSFFYLEKHLSNSNTMYLTGENITIADLMLLPEIDQLLDTAYGILPNFDKDFPYISKWINNCSNNINCYRKNYEVVCIAGKRFQQKILKHTENNL